MDTYLFFHLSDRHKNNLEINSIVTNLSGLHVERNEDQRSEERGGESVHV